MHLSLHNKAFNRLLLIANGHEVYFHDLLNLSYDVHFIDPFFDDKSFMSISSLESFLDKNNISSNETKVVYASGLERRTSVQNYLDSNFEILGNSLNKFKHLSNIYEIERDLFNKQVTIPKSEKTYNYKYLSKSHNSSGGIGVGNDIFTTDRYYQEFIPGKTYSVSFIANNNQLCVLGFNQLFNVKNNIKFPYLNAGGMMIDFNYQDREYLESWLVEFSKYYSLRGYTSIDFKIYKNKIFILDINPRLSGSYRLYRKKYHNVMSNHLSFTDNVTQKSNDYFSYIILYAKKDIVIDTRIKNIPDITDLPEIGEVIRKDSPILILNIQADNPRELYQEINSRIMCAMKIIDCYNTQLEYE